MDEEEEEEGEEEEGEKGRSFTVSCRAMLPSNSLSWGSDILIMC